MARRRTTVALADVPFHEYLWQFYAANRRKIRAGYKPLTRKFLDWNNPGEKETEAYLRRPQFEALEMYVFLKEGCGNKRLAEVFKEWQERTGAFEGRGAFRLNDGTLGLFEAIDSPVFSAAFSRMEAGAAGYPNYIYALAMGLGKTTLMATCIFYEFLLAKKYPEDERFCHNALVFAPDRTVLQSLREIQTLDKSKVVPPGYVEWLDANLKFQFLDDTSLSLTVLDGSKYNIVITNNQKIILKRSHQEKTAAETLFSAGWRAADDPFAGLDGLEEGIETEEDLIANQRFEALKRLTNLGIYVDEAHHAFGKALERDLTGGEEKSLRMTINELAASLKKAGTRVVACFNYTGTPYAGERLLPEVVYAYSLKDAIDHRYLKKAEVNAYANTRSREFVRAVAEDFWKKCGENRVEGMLPKLAFFASTIEELQSDLKPALEAVLAELEVPTDRILVNVGDAKLTGNDELREFNRLDTPGSEKQFILLVGKGKEGWNCRSLFGVALHRKAKTKVFVLQATMRCLRSIGVGQETGRVYLSEENREILSNELQENFRLNIDEFTGAGVPSGKKRVEVRMVPPPVTVKLKRVVKKYALRELELKGQVEFGLADIDPTRYDVVKTTVELERVGTDTGRKTVMAGVKDNTHYTALTLTAEVARYLGKSCRAVRTALETSKEGMVGVLEAVNRWNEVLYDLVIPELFRRFFALDEKSETQEVELRLVKPPTPPKGGPHGGGGGGNNVLAEFYVQPDLLASNGASEFAGFSGKSFHLDNYCFDSHPEMDFFKSALQDGDVAHLWFTGMLTSDKTEFRVAYVDPISHTLRNYYPDFLVEKEGGGYVVVEVKGENQIDNAVVRAKAEYATAMASASGMDYLMVPGKLAAHGLKQPQPLATAAVGPSLRVWNDDEVETQWRFTRFLPLYSLPAACGKFGRGEEVEPEGWVEVTGGGKLDERMFVVRAMGRSMEPRIHDGQLCVMRAGVEGDREGRIVLAEHRGLEDPDGGGAYSIKCYHSEKAEPEDDSWRHTRIVLKPLNPEFAPIEIPAEAAEEYKIVAEFVERVNVKE